MSEVPLTQSGGASRPGGPSTPRAAGLACPLPDLACRPPACDTRRPRGYGTRATGAATAQSSGAGSAGWLAPTPRGWAQLASATARTGPRLKAKATESCPPPRVSPPLPLPLQRHAPPLPARRGAPTPNPGKQMLFQNLPPKFTALLLIRPSCVVIFAEMF